MNNLIARLRWRLARRIAPVPVMADPFPGDGSFIVTRSGGTIASVRVATLQMSISHNLSTFAEPIDRISYATLPDYRERRFSAVRTATFWGTLG